MQHRNKISIVFLMIETNRFAVTHKVPGLVSVDGMEISPHGQVPCGIREG